MSQTSFALMTALGRAKEAAALANAGTIEITHIAIGDGATVPSGGETQLYNEVDRFTISGHGTVVGAMNTAYFDCFLAADDGPYTIREAGLIDVEGDLIAIARYDPPISKPVPTSGQTVEGTIRLEVAFSDVATVIIKVDPALKVALQRLTVLPFIPIKAMAVNNPPAGALPGDTYVIGNAPTGSWAGHAGKLTEYTPAGWAIIVPPNGHVVGLPDGTEYVRLAGAYVRRGKVRTAIEKTGIAFSDGNQDQLAEAMTRTVSGGVYFEDVGAADAYVLQPLADFVPPSQYFDGMEIVFAAAHPNTGAATVNVASLGVVPLLNENGDPLRVGRVDGSLIAARYNEAGGHFRLAPWSMAMTRPTLLGDVLSSFSMPYNTRTTLRFDVVFNSMGGSLVNGVFTAPRDGTYAFFYRATLAGMGGVTATYDAGIDASAAPGSPFGSGPALWGYAGVKVAGPPDSTILQVSGAALFQLKEGDQISMWTQFQMSSGSAAKNVTAGKMAIVLM